MCFTDDEMRKFERRVEEGYDLPDSRLMMSSGCPYTIVSLKLVYVAICICIAPCSGCD